MNTSDQNKELTVSHSETRRRGAFRMGEGAKMTYLRPSEDVMDVNHTLVDKVHRGKGLAQHLYQAMIDFARLNNRKVIPTCPFVKTMFERNPGDADLLNS